MSDVKKLTPVEIDTELSRIWQAKAQRAAWLASAKAHLERESEPFNRGHYESTYYGKQAVDRIDKLEDEIACLDAESFPYAAEFVRRGGWSRYFLVTNSNGHVHRGMDCSTCFPTTQYAWLVELADCDETAMVEAHGEMACTVCFPDAPTMPGWARSVEEREAAEAKKAEGRCPASGRIAPTSANVNGSFRLYRPWGRCPECGEGVSITSTGKFRAHKKAKVTS